MTISPRSILCVDDDLDDMMFLREAINHIDNGYKVVELRNGIEAIKYLHRAKADAQLPCLILLDVNMPLLDGKQTLDKIRTELALDNLPVVVLTSSQNPNDRALFKSKGVKMYTKPMSVAELHVMVKEFLTHCS